MLLELRCVNLEALPVLVWHTAVVPVSGMEGRWWGGERDGGSKEMGS